MEYSEAAKTAEKRFIQEAAVRKIPGMKKPCGQQSINYQLLSVIF